MKYTAIICLGLMLAGFSSGLWAAEGDSDDAAMNVESMVEQELGDDELSSYVMEASGAADVSKDVSVLVGALANKQMELDAARKEIERLKEVIRKVWQANRRERLNMHYNMGCVFKAGGQYERAEEEFLKALELDPSDPGTHYNLGILYEDDLKNKTKARSHYLKFLELSPDGPDSATVREWLHALP